MKKKLFSFTLLSATLLSLSACGLANTLSNATSQSGSEVTETGEATNSQTTAASSEATNIDLDIDTKNLKIYKNLETESYTGVDNIEDYVGTYKGYVEAFNGLEEIQTAIFEDGTFQQIRTTLAKDSQLEPVYVDESGVVQLVNTSTTVDGSNYDYLQSTSFRRGVLVELFDDVYLVPTGDEVLTAIWDQTGQLNYTDALLSASLGWYNKPISSEEDWVGYYDSVNSQLNWVDTVGVDSIDSFDYFQEGKLFGKNDFTNSASPMQKSEDIVDIVKNSLNVTLNREAVSSHISNLNDLYQYTSIGNTKIESIAPGTPIYDGKTGEKYEVIYGFKYEDYPIKFIAYTGDVFRIYSGTEENGKYIGQPIPFVR
ncbi:TPA: hypothetical protein ACHWCH_001390 [Streptococcus suis]